MKIRHCKKCNQMTNHNKYPMRIGTEDYFYECLKCKKGLGGKDEKRL